MEKSYGKLAIALSISLLVMFLLTMSMIREFSHFYLNLSNFYMALVMVAPMGLIMLAVMWGMFGKTRLNVALIAGFLVLWFGAWALGRTETFVGNEQFLKSMIPHHSRAILVCQEARITDPDIQELCSSIVETQKEEIARMQEILRTKYE